MAPVTHKGLTKILLLFFLFAGCAAVPTPLSREVASPFSSGAGAGNFTEAAHIDGIFKAIARIEIDSGGKRYPLRVALMLKLPSLMRIETIPPIGPPDFFLSMTHDTLKVFVPAKQEFYQGRATRGNFALFFPVILPPEDMVSVLMGMPPGITGKDFTFREGAASGMRSVDVLSSEGKKIMILRMDGANNHLAGMDIFSPYGEILYKVSCDEYLKVGYNIDFPQRITILSPGTNSTISVRYSDMELRREMDETLFDLVLPPGMKAIILDPEEDSRGENR